MSLDQRLREANYIKRGDDSQEARDGGQCGLLPCDYSRIVENEQTGESFRICDRFGIHVGEYDSCKYYSDANMKELIGQMSVLLQEEQQDKERIAMQKQAPKSKNRGLFLFVILCAVIFIYWYVAY